MFSFGTHCKKLEGSKITKRAQNVRNTNLVELWNNSKIAIELIHKKCIIQTVLCESEWLIFLRIVLATYGRKELNLSTYEIISAL